MRKTAKKLSLNRETLRHLEEGTLPEVIAGSPTQIDCSFCYTSCITVRATCLCTAAAATCTTTA